MVACEDTRHTQVLLDRHGIARAAGEPARAQRTRARGRAARRECARASVVALVSDAGTPLISDPGFTLVRACLAAELPVEVLPGPSAVLTALVASGLPRRALALRRLPAARARASSSTCWRAPRRRSSRSSPRGACAATLRLIAPRDPQRPVAVCRELTKLHEEVRRGSAAELAEHYGAHPARGEIVLVLGAASAGQGAARGGARGAARAGRRRRPHAPAARAPSRS